MAKALGAQLARVPGRGVGLERARRPGAQLVRRPLRPPRGERHAVAGTRDRASGDTVPVRRRPGTCGWPWEVLPGRVSTPDRGAGLRVPARTLDRPHALSLQLGDDDDARVGNHRQAGGSVLRDLGGGRCSPGIGGREHGRDSSRVAVRSKRARTSRTASSPASSGWRSTSPSRRSTGSRTTSATRSSGRPSSRSPPYAWNLRGVVTDALAPGRGFTAHPRVASASPTCTSPSASRRSSCCSDQGCPKGQLRWPITRPAAGRGSGRRWETPAGPSRCSSP